MHIANELLTPATAVVLICVTAAGLAIASWRTRAGFEAEKIPLMGVLGAFVFAAQMVNFPILPGTSGHFGGGVLLAILLGPHAATLVMGAILIIQCLIFQDGGLLALGANILNLGIIPCYLGWLLFEWLAGPRPGNLRLYVAVFIASLLGMVGGAAAVPVEVWLSGRLVVPLYKFMGVMIGLHLLVGLGEAIITFLVIGYVARVRPRLLGPLADQVSAATIGLSRGGVVLSLGLIALVLGGIVSLWASSSPDALESVTAPEFNANRPMVHAESDTTSARVSAWQEHTAPLPDYRWTSLSGTLGVLITLLMVWLMGKSLLVRRSRPQGENVY